ncbi:N-acetyltransferase [Aspergillus uvarum CBS 121591]|uniref:N-acetyltransferase n=1 Tax=Aspergillus uvarum CBS 121591 TaxID=1448315 RepID=A0A319C3C7_9EURO|nr:N-acetyltransferase [Aspergillus uvarum CBS 121591]PYH78370.1 N-acetyltransferase [Aspergillus uvarum CBS 121591]
MLLNEKTAISTSKVLLVPYSKWHVPRYHDWMKDEEIQEATASEPLSLEEEYSMQQSWRQDPDKLTLIVCQPTTTTSSSESGGGEVQLDDQLDDDPSRMVGDINLFLRVDDGEEGESDPQLVGEIELMIAEKRNQRRGFGKAALHTFLRFIVDHEAEILEEFVAGDAAASQALTGAGLQQRPWRFACLSVKIGQANERSLALFEGAGFQKVTPEPNYFGEFELRRLRESLERAAVDESLDGAGVRGYAELAYTRVQ